MSLSAADYRPRDAEHAVLYRVIGPRFLLPSYSADNGAVKMYRWYGCASTIVRC